MDIPFWLPKVNHHGSRTPFPIPAFHSLAKMCGIHFCRTTPHHPAANGLVERLLSKLKAAIMCHMDEKWIDALPLVLLGIRTANKEDLQSSAAELVYGEPLRVSGELLIQAAPKVEASAFIQQLRRFMDQLRPNATARHASRPHLSTSICGNPPTYSCGMPLYAAPWSHRTAVHTK
jgi:cleavage and polyadenylation specificity factor subunit 1